MEKMVYKSIIGQLVILKQKYPNYTFSQHISTAFADYGDIWGLTDKECLFALEKYTAELEYNVVSDDEVQKIVEDAKDLQKLFNEEEDDYE